MGPGAPVVVADPTPVCFLNLACWTQIRQDRQEGPSRTLRPHSRPLLPTGSTHLAHSPPETFPARSPAGLAIPHPACTPPASSSWAWPGGVNLVQGEEEVLAPPRARPPLVNRVRMTSQAWAGGPASQALSTELKEELRKCLLLAAHSPSLEKLHFLLSPGCSLPGES